MTAWWDTAVLAPGSRKEREDNEGDGGGSSNETNGELVMTFSDYKGETSNRSINQISERDPD